MWVLGPTCPGTAFIRSYSRDCCPTHRLDSRDPIALNAGLFLFLSANPLGARQQCKNPINTTLSAVFSSGVRSRIMWFAPDQLAYFYG